MSSIFSCKKGENVIYVHHRRVPIFLTAPRVHQFDTELVIVNSIKINCFVYNVHYSNRHYREYSAIVFVHVQLSIAQSTAWSTVTAADMYMNIYMNIAHHIDYGAAFVSVEKNCNSNPASFSIHGIWHKLIVISKNTDNAAVAESCKYWLRLRLEIWVTNVEPNEWISK